MLKSRTRRARKARALPGEDCRDGCYSIDRPVGVSSKHRTEDVWIELLMRQGGTRRGGELFQFRAQQISTLDDRTAGVQRKPPARPQAVQPCCDPV